MASIEHLHRVKTGLETRFYSFRANREDKWQPLLRGHAPSGLTQALTEFAGRYEVNSPALEYELGQVVASYMLQGSKIDVTSLETTERAKKICEENRIWFASWLSRFNHGRRFDEQFATWTATVGIAVWRLLWQAPEEPEVKSTADEGYASYERRRIEAYLEANEDTFRLVNVNPLTLKWWPLDNPTDIVEESILSDYRASELTRKSDGKRVGLSKDGKTIEFYGPGETDTAPRDSGGRQIRFTVYEYKDAETGKWMHYEYVCPEGAGIEAEEELDKFEVPLGRSSYFFAASGEENVSETDPDLRFRPPLLPMIRTVSKYNFWHSAVGALAVQQMAGQKIYLDASKATPEALQALRELGVNATTQGDTLVISAPTADSSEIAVLPGLLQQWPALTPDALSFIIEGLEAELARYRTNRFLTGDLSASETTGAPTSTILAQMQAAAVPAGKALAKLNRVKEEICGALRNFVLYFDEDVEDEEQQKRYPVVATGDLPLAKGRAEPGEVVVITAAKMRHRFDINVSTANKSQQEMLLEKQDAYADLDRGTITFVQCLERLGHDDPETQARELNKERHKLEAQSQFAASEQRERAIIWGELTGLGDLIEAAPQLETGGTGVQQGSPTRTPAPSQMMGAPLVPGATG